MSLTPRFLFLFFIPLGILLHCCQSDPEEIVSIPDTEFLHALVEEGVDKNGDGLISYPEAEATTSIRLSPSSISDLSGLEAFINLDSLMILMNPISSLDLSGNISLKYLSCTGCELNQLDVSHNPHLRHLDCSGGASMSNALTHLDLSIKSSPGDSVLFGKQAHLSGPV